MHSQLPPLKNKFLNFDVVRGHVDRLGIRNSLPQATVFAAPLLPTG